MNEETTARPATVTTPALSVRGVTKRFGGVKALDGVDLDLYPGEVHCLAGENGCGKSTLIKIISGAERPDSGQLSIDGQERAWLNTTEAIRAGIQVIYQDFSMFPNLTVAENISLTASVAERSRLYNQASARERAARILDELGISIPLEAEVGDLTVADRQLTAIARALASEARVIIMDEPTTALTQHEVSNLFRVVDGLRLRGVALLFVSHKLNEVLTISQQLSIIRSGRVVTSGPADTFTPSSIAEAMTGHLIEDARSVAPLTQDATPILELASLTLPGVFSDVSFTLAPGEILGLTGLLGSGRTEVAETIFGLRSPMSGSMMIDGRKVSFRDINDAIGAGVGYVPEDRLTQGLFLNESISDNIAAASLEEYRGPGGLIAQSKVSGVVSSLFKRLSIKAPSAKLPVRMLSGGNAQRIVIAKWLATKPKILLMNGPTVGVDVGSKQQIIDLLRAEAANGMGIVVISDDAAELVTCCHRVAIMVRGRITQVLTGDEVTEQRILEGMSQRVETSSSTR